MPQQGALADVPRDVQNAGRDVGESIHENAAQEVAERVGAPLSIEQQDALRTLAGPERAATLIGPAGTGKGVVIDAAARAEQLAGRETIGVAVSGSSANPHAQSPTTPSGGSCTSRTPATRRVRLPCSTGTPSPKNTGSRTSL
jgi:hypothetical protein